MTAREWLNRGRRIDKEIEALLRERERLVTNLTSGTADLGSTPVSGTKDPHKFDRLVELIAKIDERTDALYAIKCEIIEAIGKVSDTRYRAILTERYVEMRSFEQIAVDLNYSWRQTIRLHGAALMAVAPYCGGEK